MKKNKKKKPSGLIANIIFSLVALFSLTVAIVFVLLNYSLKNRIDVLSKENLDYKTKQSIYIYSQEDLDKAILETEKTEEIDNSQQLLDSIKQMMNSGKTTYFLLRTLFPEDVVVVGNNNNYEFFPIAEEVKKNTYIPELFLEDEETGEIVYTDDNGNVISKKGIDVSSHNGKINWKKVKADGVDFAFIRVGYRGNTEGGLSLDQNFKTNIKEAMEAGVEVGVYFYTQAITVEEAKEEAQFVLDAIEPYNISYPVAFDLEEYKGGRAEEVSKEDNTLIAKAFMDMVEKAGYESMLYGNLRTMFLMVDYKEVASYDKWIAYYAYPLYYPYEYVIWQYTSDGKVDGISGNVDMNICLGNPN